MRGFTSREDRPRSVFGRLIAGLTAAALVAGCLPAVASAEEPPFQLDLEVVAEKLLAAQIQVRESGQDGIKRLLMSAEFLEWARQHPTEILSGGISHLEGRGDGLTDGVAPYRDRSDVEFAMRGMATLVADPGSVAAASPHIRRLVEVTLGKSVAAFDTREDLVYGSLREADWLRARIEAEADVYAAVRRQALADPDFAAIWNEFFGSAGLDATASLDQMKADPKLLEFVNVDAILAQQATSQGFLAEIQRQFGLVAARLATESEQARARLVALSATCPVSPESGCTPEQQAAAKDKAEKEQKEIDGAATAAKLLGGLARIADIKSGEKIEKVATAWFSFVTAINKYTDAVAGRNAEDAIWSAASLALTGDVLSTVFTLVGLLGDSGPSLDQRILDQVIALRKEVRAMHQEMRSSFQRIETRLDGIYLSMMNEFDKLNAGLAGNTAALTGIQNTLAEQNLRLESVAATILAAVGEVELHDTRSDVNRYIGYREIFGQAIPSFVEYTQPENQFHLAATEIATHPSFVVPASLAFDSSVSPTAILDTNGDAAALSYLARRATARDPRVPDPVQPFAHPAIWSLGAQAHALLALQNPSLATQVSPLRTDQIVFEGERIGEVTRAFSRPASTPSSDRTNPVFKTLLDEHRAALAAVGSRLAQIRTVNVLPRRETPFPLPPPPPPPQPPQQPVFYTTLKTYGLFGTATQAVPESTLPPEVTTLRPCGVGDVPPIGPMIGRPANLSFKAVASEVRFAHYAYSPTMEDTVRLPELAHCYDAQFVNLRETYGTLYHDTYARLRLTMRTRFRWAHSADVPWYNARNATYSWPEMRIMRECQSIHCSGGSSTTVAEALTVRYPRDKAIFEQSATISTDAGFLDGVRKEMAAFLLGRQRKLYALAAIESGTANTTLNQAGAALARTARELQAYTRLGFPVALAGDDILSSLLFGKYPLLVDKPSDPQLQATFNNAFNRYQCAPATGVGQPCYNGPFFPLRSQPHLETNGGLTIYDPVYCRVSTAGVPGVSGDAVGDCLVASGMQRANALQGRYRTHSNRLLAGTYVERLPWLDTTLAALPLVDAIVRPEVPE